jgi:hypothetical protein
MHHNSFNFEYANATHAQLTEWEDARLLREGDEYQALLNERYEESVRKSYEARGLANIY